ncbi:MAG: hypothetical protein KF716_31420 [Anaerolineae bacterium]|nr:hypothetical protein [Anaerolineae bacterium]
MRNQSRQRKHSGFVFVFLLYSLIAFLPGCLYSNLIRLLLNDSIASPLGLIFSIIILLFPYLAITFVLLGFPKNPNYEKPTQYLTMGRLMIAIFSVLTIAFLGLYIMSTHRLVSEQTPDTRSGFDAPVGDQYLGAWLAGVSSGLLLLSVGYTNSINLNAKIELLFDASPR